MTGNDAGYSTTPSFGTRANGPVTDVTFQNVTKFIAILNSSSSYLASVPPGYQFALPTEAQWEFACRAGTTTAFHVGNEIPLASVQFGAATIPTVANVMGRQDFTDVGTFPPNNWGFHDMHGNAWEYTADWYAPYPQGPLTNPEGPSSGSMKIIRGGATNNYSSLARSANRQAIGLSQPYYFPGGGRMGRNGFRVALRESN